MTFHFMVSYLRPELRLPLCLPFDPDETDMLQNRFELSTSWILININPDRKWCNYPGVDTASMTRRHHRLKYFLILPPLFKMMIGQPLFCEVILEKSYNKLKGTNHATLMATIKLHIFENL